MNIIEKDLKLGITLEGLDTEFIYAIFDVVSFVEETTRPVPEAPEFKVDIWDEKPVNLRFANKNGKLIGAELLLLNLDSACLEYLVENWRTVFNAVQALKA